MKFAKNMNQKLNPIIKMFAEAVQKRETTTKALKYCNLVIDPLYGYYLLKGL